jgi:16S rRNA (cytidine1402-2'-O)-methyltransferase
MTKGCLYLIPTTLGETPVAEVIPLKVLELINEIDEYIVEDLKHARRYLKKAGLQKPIDSLTFHLMDKHSDAAKYEAYLKNIELGRSIGIISEAGCPGIADPGAEVVAIAHRKNIKVVPLSGPSSVLLALMASGFNGQNFAFNGYLPIDKVERIKKIKFLESLVYKVNQTQLFIETPFRNQQLLTDLVQQCAVDTRLCIAADLTLPTEFIRTLKIKEWKAVLPELHKRPCIFLLYK